MGNKTTLMDRLRDNVNQVTIRKDMSLQDYLQVRKPLDVNQDLLEGNPDIDTILSTTESVFDEKNIKSETRFQVSAYEKQIKDKRFRSTEVKSVRNGF